MASSSSSSTSSSTTSHSNPASAPAPSAAGGALHPVHPAVSAAGGPNCQAAPSDSAAPTSTSPSTTSNSSSASALVPSATDGARHPGNPALSAAGGPNRQATTSDPSASSSTASNVSKETWPALIDIISPSKGVDRGAAPPATASASAASPSPSLRAAAASSRAAARQTTPKTSWGSKGRVPQASTGLALLRQGRRPDTPKNNRSRGRPDTPKKENYSSRGRGSSSTAVTGGYEEWEAAPAPYPTSSTPPKKVWGNPTRPPRLPSGLPSSSSISAAATGAPIEASHSSPAPLLTRFAGHDTSPSCSSSAEASSGESPRLPSGLASSVSMSAAATGAPIEASHSSPAPLLARFAGHDTSPSSASSAEASSRESPRLPSGLASSSSMSATATGAPIEASLTGVLGAFPAAPAGGDAAVAADASDDTVEGMRQQAAVALAPAAPLLGGFAGDDLGQDTSAGRVGEVLGQATNTGRVVPGGMDFLFESWRGAPRLPSPGGDMMGLAPPRRDRTFLPSPEQDRLWWENARLRIENSYLRDELLERLLEVMQNRRTIDVLETRLQSQAAAQAEAQTERQLSGERCFDCQILPAAVRFAPCGHIRLCFNCYNSRQKCPSCMRWITWIRLP